MKRVASVLLSVVFWLTALPWGAVSAAMDGNIIINGDFEDGKTGWSCNSGTAEIISDAYDGICALQLTNPSAWGEAAIQTVDVQPDTDYTITWYTKRVSGSGAFNLFLMNPADWTNLKVSGQNWMNETSGHWVKNEVVVNTGSATQVLLKFSAETSTAGSIIVDDVHMIPVGWQPPVEPDAPTDNMLINGDFETGDYTGWTNLWDKNVLTMVSGHHGSYALHVDASEWTHVRQEVEVEPYTDYVITGWYKNATDMTLLVKDGSDSKNLQQTYMNGGADWTQVTLEVNSGDNWHLYVSLMGNWVNAGGIFDDFTMYPVVNTPEEPDDPTPLENFVVNGDFETGDNTGWMTYQDSYVTWEAAYTGFYGLHLRGDGGWGGMAYQSISVEPGVEYTISMQVKVISNGFNIIIRDGGEMGANVAGQWCTNTGWSQVTLTVTPTTDTLCINFCGGGNGWSESVYVDDVTVIALQEPEVPADTTNRLQNGDFETGDTTGWDNVWGSNTISITEGHDSAYAMHVISGLWTHVRQLVNVEPNTDYVITGWYKDVNKMTLVVKDGADTKNLYQSSLTDGTSGWTKVVLEINSGDETSLLLSLMGWEDGAEGTFDDFSMIKAADLPATGELINGNFERWSEGWYLNPSYAYISGESSYSGHYSLALDNPSAWSEAASQTIAVEPYTEYVITWYSQRVSGNGAFILALLDAESSNNLYITDGQSWMNETSGDWVKYRLLVSTGDCTQMMLKWTAEYYNPGKILIDNITVEENDPDAPIWTEYPPIEENQLVNGDFEEGHNGWIWWDPTRLDDTTAFKGDYSVCLDNERQWSAALEQVVALRPDTDYVITFYTRRESGSKSWSLFLLDAESVYGGAPVNIPFTQPYSTNWFQQSASDGWVKTHLEFNSGNIAKALLKFGPNEDYAGTFWLDNVGLYVKGNEPWDEPTVPKESAMLTAAWAEKNRPIAEEYNLLEDGSFEMGSPLWGEDEYLSVVEDDTTRWGNRSLFFDTSAVTQYEAVSRAVMVPVEPNTTYVFSMWLKGDFLSENNCGRATIGVTNSSGRFLSIRDVLFLDGSRQIVPSAWDNAWHLCSVEFYTGTQTEVNLTLYGWGSRMWVDDMALFEEWNGQKYVSANMAGNVQVDYGVEHTICKDADSLIPDPSMNTADATGFWADSDGWRNGFMSFADGAMKYTSTGDNAATYTIKWVDVEPYTDYTFSMDLKILEDGGGRIALLDGKLLDKVEFYSISFDSYDYTDEGEYTGWRNLAIYFNSDAYDRIGIAFVDDGGEVLLDNMRLFETGDGMTAAMGDINEDGTVNMRDAGLLQRYLNGWDVVILTEVADVTGDGKINVQDMALLQRYLCGWDVSLGG